MVLIEGKLYESKVLESKYPDCELEMVYSPDRPGSEYTNVPENIALKWQKLLERIHEDNIQIKKLIELMIPPIDLVK
jgi:GTP-binding protein EngB required for normal cell division